jgi:PmbA protein
MPETRKLLERAAQAVELARKAGAEHAWATTSHGREVEYEYRDGNLERVKDATSQGLSLKIYQDGRYASYSTNDLAPDRLGPFVSEAVAMTAALQPDPYREITPAELFADRPEVDLELVDPSILELSRDRRLAWCQELDELTHNDQRLISGTAAVYDGNSSSASVSSNGFSGSSEATYLWLGSQLTYRDRGDRRASGYFFAGGPQSKDVPPTKTIAETAIERVRARLGAEQGPTVRTTMVVDPSIAPSLIGRLLGPARASSLQQGQSFYKALPGTKAFSEVLSITDDPLIPRGLGSRLFDGEGISARKMPVIEQGIVRNLYVDTYYGRKLGMKPTTGSSSNLVIGLGKRSLAEIVADVDDGILVTSWLGGNADSTTGEFSLGLRGHRISQGKIGGPIDEMNVTGDLQSLFETLVEVGNDPWPYSSTRAPTLVFEGVQFSGA